MRCLYLSQELAPHFTEGGLGLTTASFPAALHAATGIESTIMLPYYPWLVTRAGLRTERLATLPPLRVGGRREEASIHRAPELGGPCEVLLVRSDRWYQRDGGIYRDHDYVEYDDAVPRAAFFGWCVARWLEAEPGRFSVIHGNDWQSGMAMFLAARLRRAAGSASPGLVFQIHTAEALGRISPAVLPALGLGGAELAEVAAISAGEPSMMQLAMSSADALVTCSPGYAQELRAMMAGTPLLEPLERLGITGIVSGIDPDVWDPAHREAPVRPYTAATVDDGKPANKLALQAACGFPADPSRPLLGICSRLVPEKGPDLVLDGLAGLLRAQGVQLAVMGVGDREYTEGFQRLAAELPAAARYWPAFDMRLARLLYAGCDFTLMPSLVEPCGLNQLISMRFGTLPIVSPVGGLKDTVIDLTRHPETGSGFVLGRPGVDELCEAVDRSVRWLAGDAGVVLGTRRRVMGLDWSWRRTVVEFAALFEALTDRPPAGSVRRAAPGGDPG